MSTLYSYRTQPVMCLPVNITVDLPIIPQHFFHCSAPLGLNTPVATVTICVSIKEVVKGNIQGKTVKVLRLINYTYFP